MPRTPEQYATYLSNRRDALAQFQPTSSNEQTTTDSHRKLIIAAFFNANGDPADGRWTHIAHLCRLATTRGGHRWLGTGAERRAQGLDGQGQSTGKPGLDTEKRRNKRCLRQKVESWKQTVTREMADNVEHASDVGKRPGPAAFLDFKVMKRTALTNTPKTSRSNGTNPVLPEQQATSSDLSYLPPSFPSNLATSTPQRPGRRKPPSIPSLSQTASSNLVSPQKVQLYDGTFAPKENPGVGHSSPSSTRNIAQSTPARLPTFADLNTPHSALPQSDTNFGYDFSRSNIRSPSHSNIRASKTDVLHPNINGDPEPRQVHNLSISDNDDFDPPFTSTQKDTDAKAQIPFKISGDHQWKGYSSQFDLDRRVGEVAKLLEKDVVWYQNS